MCWKKYYFITNFAKKRPSYFCETRGTLVRDLRKYSSRIIAEKFYALVSFLKLRTSGVVWYLHLSFQVVDWQQFFLLGYLLMNAFYLYRSPLIKKRIYFYLNFPHVNCLKPVGICDFFYIFTYARQMWWIVTKSLLGI